MVTTARETHAHLRRILDDALLTAEPLRQHTTFRIGGPADYFVAPQRPDVLVAALGAARELALPAFLVGGGSNLLVSDAGLRGLVVRNACEALEFDGDVAHVECGADYLEFIGQCCVRGLAGLGCLHRHRHRRDLRSLRRGVRPDFGQSPRARGIRGASG